MGQVSDITEGPRSKCWDEANALAGLGHCAQAEGRIADAEKSLQQARDTFHRIGAAAETGRITTILDRLKTHLGSYEAAEGPG